MRVFFDENMPRPLGRVIDGHEVSYVEKEGWKGKENGELLDLVEGKFDVILTSDGSITYQNVLRGRDLSVIVVPTNNLTLLRANAVAIRSTLDEMAARDHRAIVTIDWRGRRLVRRLGSEGSDAELRSVPPFTRQAIGSVATTRRFIGDFKGFETKTRRDHARMCGEAGQIAVFAGLRKA